MKYLNNILLINWNGFSYESMHLGKISLLTGRNRSGKSSIIDAIQLLFFGETDGRSYFNKAANEKASRTLLGYLFGERDTGERYIRNDKFVSYVAGEIFDETKGTTDLAVFAANCHTEGVRDFTHLWSIIPNTSISDIAFLSDDESGRKVPLGLVSFRDVVRKRNGEIYNENKRYLKNLQLYEGYMGEGGEEYISLLRKAIPFSLRVNDLRGFITEYICKKNDKVNVSETRKNLEAVKETEKIIENIENEISRLEEISSADNLYQDKRNLFMVDDYGLSKAYADDASSKYNNLVDKCGQMEADCASRKENLKKIKDQQTALSKVIQDLNTEIASSDKEQERRRLEIERDRLAAEAEKYQRNAEKTIASIKYAGSVLRKITSGAEALDIEIPMPDFTFSGLEDMNMESFLLFQPEPFVDYQDDVYSSIIKKEAKLDNEYSECVSRQKRLETRLNDLQNGLKPFPSGVEEFRKALTDKLGKECKILADFVEVKDQSWRDAIESFLGDRRFDLMLSTEEYACVADIIRDFEWKNVSAVDLDKIPETCACMNSVVEALSFDDKGAEKYVTYLLGGVRKNSSEEKYITEDGIYSEGNHKVIAFGKTDPFLGGNAIAIQIESTKRELNEVNEKLKDIRTRLEFLQTSHTDLRVRPSLMSIKEAIENADSLEGLYDEINHIVVRLSSLFDQEVENKKAELKKKTEENDALNIQSGKIMASIADLESKISSIKDILPSYEEKMKDCIATLASKSFEPEWIEAEAEPVYQKILKEVRMDYGSVALSFTGRLANSRHAMDSAKRTRDSLRLSYKSNYHFGGDPYEESNEAYDARLYELKSNALLKYKTELDEEEKRANKVFHEDFLYGIKAGIEDAETRIRVINKTLDKLNFGGTSYKFSIERNKGEFGRFYDMFRDKRLVVKDEIDLFNDNSVFFREYSSEIQELFSVLRGEKEGDIEALTDYRTYLSFDLIETDAQGKSRSLAKMASKQSGGETQLAFYICITAAFAQICRVYETVQNNTLRLIIFDEAFSKMDGERISKFVKWFSTLDLQLLVCTPTEKVGQIFIDKNVEGHLVIRKGDAMRTTMLDYEGINEWRE